MDIKVLASGSKGNAYIVSDGKTSLLLECGLPYRKLQQKSHYSLSKIDACLLTHEHKDHSAAVKDVLKSGLDVYTSKGTAEALNLRSHRLHTVHFQDNKEVAPFYGIGSFQVRAFKAEHDAAEPIMFIIHSVKTNETLLFATDTAFIRYKFNALTHLMIEANYLYDQMDINEYALNTRIMRSHMSLPAVEKYLKSIDTSKLKQVWLLHLSDERADEAAIKKRVQELTGAEVYIA